MEHDINTAHSCLLANAPRRQIPLHASLGESVGERVEGGRTSKPSSSLPAHLVAVLAPPDAINEGVFDGR